MGVGFEEAEAVAAGIASANPDANLAQGLTKTATAVTKPQPVKRHSKGKVVMELLVDRFDARPNDYRRAIAHAKSSNVTVLRQLKEFGMAPLLEDVLEI